MKEATMIRCAFCAMTVPDVPDAIDAGWIPSYYDNQEEKADPVCLACQQAYLEVDPKDGEFVIKASPHIVKRP